MLIAAAGWPQASAAQSTTAAGKQVATPVLSPAGGTFSTPQVVAISTTTANASVYYTVDGRVPTVNSTLYTGAITVSTTTTVRAIAVRKNWTQSDVAEGTFTMNFGTLTPPEMSPAAGTYRPPLSVSISAQTGSTIRYTLDGSLPNEASAIYTAPLPIASTTTLRARAFRRDYTASADVAGTYTVWSDVIPPSITAALSAVPGAAGWLATPVTVTFTCTDADSAIVSCTSPVTIGAEGSSIVSGEAVDAAGNTATLQVAVNIDLTAPTLSVSSPSADEPLPSSTTIVTVRGSVQDVSGISTLTCATVPAPVIGGVFECDVPVVAGTNPVPVEATDLAGHTSLLTLTFTVLEPGSEPTSIQISPESLVMFVGETRGLAVTDDRGRLVSGGTWTFSAPIAEVAQRPGGCVPTPTTTCLEPNDLTIVRAVASGDVTVTVSYLGLTTASTLTIFSSGTAPSSGTMMWTLSSGTQVPVRAQVIPAVPPPDGDPLRDAALFFVDEGRQWSGNKLVPVNGSKLEIRAANADGRELWRMRATGPALLKYGALADQRGGIVVMMENGYDDATQSFFPDKVRRFDGRTGAVTWEYEPEWFYTLSEPAVHPDGTVYFTEQAGISTDPPSHLVGIAADGTVMKWTLPTGTYTRHDSGTGLMEVDHRPSPALAGQPIIRDDGTVVLVARTLESTQYVISYYDSNGNLTWRNDTSQVAEFIYSGWVVELGAGGAVQSHQVARGASVWTSFRPQDWKLLPDGQDGLLMGHRSQRNLLHFDVAYQVLSGVLATGSGTTYGMEYVLGDDGAYALEHGVLSGSYWSKTYRFDPVTLAVSNTTWVTANQVAPSNLRLQFATAGGGVYLSGPTVSPATASTLTATATTPIGNATQVSNGVWAGWSSGPALVVADERAVAITAWPFATGTVEATNTAFIPGVGIFAKGHAVAGLFRHVSIRMVPRDQDYWRQLEPEVFKEFDIQTGRYFGTIGAGLPDGDTGIACTGTLISDFDRPADVTVEAKSLERLQYSRFVENMLIALLIQANRNYRDELRYECFPDAGEAEYNSNSYAAGIIKAVGVSFPRFPSLMRWLYPGWGQAVPTVEFATQP